MYNSNTYSNQYSNVTDYSLCYLNFRMVNNPINATLTSLTESETNLLLNTPSD